MQSWTLRELFYAAHAHTADPCSLDREIARRMARIEHEYITLESADYALPDVCGAGAVFHTYTARHGYTWPKTFTGWGG